MLIHQALHTKISQRPQQTYLRPISPYSTINYAISPCYGQLTVKFIYLIIIPRTSHLVDLMVLFITKMIQFSITLITTTVLKCPDIYMHNQHSETSWQNWCDQIIASILYVISFYKRWKNQNLEKALNSFQTLHFFHKLLKSPQKNIFCFSFYWGTKPYAINLCCQIYMMRDRTC